MAERAQVAERRERMLDHIGRYRVTLRATLEHLFGLDPANDILELRRAGLVTLNHGLPGRLGCYRLTAAGAVGRVPRDRGAADFVGRALLTHLSVLWFSCMGEQSRVRLEADELERLLGDEAPAIDQAPHCADQVAPGEEETDEARLYRVFVLGQRSREDHTLASITRVIDAALRARGKLARWIESGVYGFAVLTEMEERCEDLRAELARRGLMTKARFLVEPAPGPATLKRALDGHRSGRAQRS